MENADILQVPGYYRITVTLKESQKTYDGNYLITCINPSGTISPYVIPFKSLVYAANDFRATKIFINSLIDEQIEKIEITFK